MTSSGLHRPTRHLDHSELTELKVSATRGPPSCNQPQDQGWDWEGQRGGLKYVCVAKSSSWNEITPLGSL